MFNPACAFCLFVIKKLESLLPLNVTEVTLVNMSFITSHDGKLTFFFSVGNFDKANGGGL